MGAAPQVVDSEEAEGGDGEAIYVAIGIDVLSSLLSSSEEGGKVVRRIELDGGIRGWVEAINKGRRGPDDGWWVIGGAGKLKKSDEGIGISISKGDKVEVVEGGVGGEGG